jgi:hypothetical protein
MNGGLCAVNKMNRLKTFFYALALITNIEIFCDPTPVLCVDIGGTRIKAAILHPDITLEELQGISTLAFESKEWLNEDISRLFSPDTPGNLYEKIGVKYDEVSIGVRGPVKDGAYCVVPKEHLPREMKQKCQEAAKCPVFLECDTGIWARGALYWQSLIKQNISFPCLGITLGTGIGVVLISAPDDIINIEISVIDSPFERLCKLTKNQPLKQEYGRPAPHDAIGMPFFLWSQKERPFFKPQLVQTEYNARILAFIKDMQAYLTDKLGIEISSIMMGGGNSRLIIPQDLESELNKRIVLLSPDNIAKYGVSFDIISLLGCLMIRVNPPVKMLPSWSEMLPWYTPLKMDLYE